MAKQSNSMFRITQLAKDLGLKPKDLTSRLEEIGATDLSSSEITRNSGGAPAGTVSSGRQAG